MGEDEKECIDTRLVELWMIMVPTTDRPSGDEGVSEEVAAAQNMVKGVHTFSM